MKWYEVKTEQMMDNGYMTQKSAYLLTYLEVMALNLIYKLNKQKCKLVVWLNS